MSKIITQLLSCPHWLNCIAQVLKESSFIVTFLHSIHQKTQAAKLSKISYN